MITTITPEMAKALLEKNTKNRNPSKRQIAFLTNEILNDRFVFNGESIIVAEDGTLLDGQHRLMAVVEAGKPIQTVLVEGVPREAQKTIDVGTSRTAANVISMEGIKNSTALAAGIRMILNGFEDRAKTGGRTSTTEIIEAYKKEEQLIGVMVDYTMHLYNVSSKVLSAGRGMAYLYLFALEDKLAKHFIKEVYTGYQYGKSNAAILLRNKLINDKLSRKKMTEKYKKELFIAAWRRYLAGDMLETLKVTDTAELKFVPYGGKSKLRPVDFDEEDE